MIRIPLLWKILGIACVAGSAHAAVLFSDDFESYTVSVAVPTGTFPANNWATTSGNGIVSDEATSTAFGDPNQFYYHRDNTASGLSLRSNSFTEASNAVSTFSFDFFEPTVGGTERMVVGYGINTGDLGGANRRLVIELNGGTITSMTAATTGSNTYSLDTSYRLFMIFNDSASSVNYAGGTIPAGIAHIWLQDSLGVYTFAGTDGVQNTGTAETSYAVAFQQNSNAHLQDIYIDNVLFETGAAAIPEPSAALLGGLGMIALLRRRRA